MEFIIDSLFNTFSGNMAIDLGTANTLIYMKRKGIVLNEPSVVSIAKSKNQVLAVGSDAKKMIGKTPGNIIAIRPMRDGVIADFEAAEVMLKHFIRKARSRRAFFRPRIVIAVPSGITPVEKSAVIESAEQAGARDVFLIEEPMAAAIGTNLPVGEPTCSMVIDIGGGTTEVAVISLYGTVYSSSIRVAGDKMDFAIKQFVKSKYNLLIGDESAERIKMTIGNAYPDYHSMDVKGRDSLSGIPRIISINAEDIRVAISEQIDSIIDGVKLVLEKTPPELAADIVDNGVVLTGGVALLKNLDKLIQEEVGIPVKRAENPLLTVALGSGKTLCNTQLLKNVMINDMHPNIGRVEFSSA